MKSDRYDELDYLIGFTVCERMYNEGVMSYESFCRINRAMARTVGVEPIIELSHIRQESSDLVKW